MLTKADLFPQSDMAKRILLKRAEQLATQQLTHPDMTAQVSYIRFRLGTTEQYGIPYLYAKEVLQHVHPTTLPRAPQHVAGVINYRGALIVVLNLKAFFKVTDTEQTTNPYIIIVQHKHITLGMLADDIIGGDSYVQGNLDNAIPSLGATKPEYILGIQHGLITILNTEALISDLQGG